MNWIRRIMNKLFVDIDEDDITNVKVKGNVGGSIEANSIEVGGEILLLTLLK